jgi:two-component system chemotaxis response regulator CheB
LARSESRAGGAPEGRKPFFDIIAMGASAGGLKALKAIITELPDDLEAPIVVVQHLDPRRRSLMAKILGRHTHLNVKQAESGEELLAGTVYIAPPNQHLLVNADHTLSLTQSELVHFVRPSADLLFESVAASYKDRAVCVVLTGTGNDGTMGVKAVKKIGGTTIAQDEGSSDFFGMPGGAIRTGEVDFILPLCDIPSALVSLLRGEER